MTSDRARACAAARWPIVDQTQAEAARKALLALAPGPGTPKNFVYNCPLRALDAGKSPPCPGSGLCRDIAAPLIRA